MFTRNIKNIIQLGKSGVKWKDNLSETAISIDPIVQAKELLKKIRESTFKSSELKQLRDLLQKAGKANVEKNKTLRAELITELTKPIRTQDEWNNRDYSNPTEGDKKDIKELLSAWEKDFQDAEKKNDNSKAKVKEATQQEFDTTLRGIKPPDFKLGELEREKDGTLTLSTMVGVLSDLDGNGVVESTNRGWFKRTFTGGGEQHFPIGELQVANELKDNIKTPRDLNDLAQRLGVNLPWDTKLDSISIHRDDKIGAFRKALIEEVSIMADISAMILGNDKARTGLKAVITGKTDELQNVLIQNKDALKKIQAVVEKNPNLAEKILSALVKVGIMLPLAVLSNGMAVGFVETADLSIKDGETGSLTAKTAIGKSGSIAASLDLIGVRLEANTNDQGVRILGRTKIFLDAVKPKNEGDIPKKADVMNAVNNAIIATLQDIKDDKMRIEAQKIDASYRKSQEKIMEAFVSNKLTKSDVPALLDQLVQNTFTYYARVEELQGFQFKGLWAGLMKQGIGLGLSGGITTVSYTQDGTNIAGGVGESLMNAKKLTQEEKERVLNNEKYSYILNYKDGTETLRIKGYKPEEKLPADLQKLQASGHLKIEGTTLVIRTKSGNEQIFAQPSSLRLPNGQVDTYYAFGVAEKVQKRNLDYSQDGTTGVITIKGFKVGESLTHNLVSLQKSGNLTVLDNGDIRISPKDKSQILELLSDRSIVIRTTNKGNPSEISNNGSSEVISKEAQSIISKYPQSSEWRKRYPTAFGKVQQAVMSGDIGDAYTELSNLARISRNKKMGELVKELADNKDETTKEDVLSLLINETVGIQAFRNYGKNGTEKKTFGEVYKLTHPESVMKQYDLYDAKLMGFEDLDKAMKDPEFNKYIEEKRKFRTDSHKLFDASPDKERSVEKVDDKGYFTLMNFAQTSGGLKGLMSQHADEVLQGSVAEFQSLSNDQKKKFLETVFADKRYESRVNALKNTAQSGIPPNNLVRIGELTQLLLGEKVHGVSLKEPIKFYRAEYSKCANEMILISKPIFQKDTTTTESLKIPFITPPDTERFDLIRSGTVAGGDVVSLMSAGLGAGRSWKEDTDAPVGSDPNKGDPVITPKPTGDQ